MRLYFRPLLVPTLWLIPLLAILCALGTWQIERLHWKLDLLAKIHTGLTAPPTTLADAWGFGSDVVMSTSDRESEADYKRVKVLGHFLNGQKIFFFTTGSGARPVYHLIVPFVAEHPWTYAEPCNVCVTFPGAPSHRDWRRSPYKQDVTIFVDRGWLPIDLPSSMLATGDLHGTYALAGIIRKPAPPNWFTPPVDKPKRIVHTRDPDVLAKAFGYKNVFPMFLEADATPNPGGWPKGGVTVIDLPNDHLQYAITWFGLAIGLLAVYLTYHASRGRLGWR